MQDWHVNLMVIGSDFQWRWEIVGESVLSPWFVSQGAVLIYSTYDDDI